MKVNSPFVALATLASLTLNFGGVSGRAVQRDLSVNADVIAAPVFLDGEQLPGRKTPVGVDVAAAIPASTGNLVRRAPGGSGKGGKGGFPAGQGGFQAGKGGFPAGQGGFPAGQGSSPPGKGGFPTGKGSPSGGKGGKEAIIPGTRSRKGTPPAEGTDITTQDLRTAGLVHIQQSNALTSDGGFKLMPAFNNQQWKRYDISPTAATAQQYGGETAVIAYDVNLALGAVDVRLVWTNGFFLMQGPRTLPAGINRRKLIIDGFTKAGGNMNNLQYLGDNDVINPDVLLAIKNALGAKGITNYPESDTESSSSSSSSGSESGSPRGRPRRPPPTAASHVFRVGEPGWAQLTASSFYRSNVGVLAGLAGQPQITTITVSWSALGRYSLVHHITRAKRPASQSPPRQGSSSPPAKPPGSRPRQGSMSGQRPASRQGIF